MKKTIIYGLIILLLTAFVSAEIVTYETGEYEPDETAHGYDNLIIYNGDLWEEVEE